MDFIAFLWLIVVAIKAPGFFLSLPSRMRREKEERLIRRYGKERYMEMKFKAELDACKKDPAAEARIKKADSFIKRAVFGQKDDPDSDK